MYTLIEPTRRVRVVWVVTKKHAYTRTHVARISGNRALVFGHVKHQLRCHVFGLPSHHKTTITIFVMESARQIEFFEWATGPGDWDIQHVFSRTQAHTRPTHTSDMQHAFWIEGYNGVQNIHIKSVIRLNRVSYISPASPSPPPPSSVRPPSPAMSGIVVITVRRSLRGRRNHINVFIFSVCVCVREYNGLLRDCVCVLCPRYVVYVPACACMFVCVLWCIEAV